jgi:hypothetical protein
LLRTGRFGLGDGLHDAARRRRSRLAGLQRSSHKMLVYHGHRSYSPSTTQFAGMKLSIKSRRQGGLLGPAVHGARVTHCGGGVGLEFDALSALMDGSKATRHPFADCLSQPGKQELPRRGSRRTRPLCPWPTTKVWRRHQKGGVLRCANP